MACACYVSDKRQASCHRGIEDTGMTFVLKVKLPILICVMGFQGAPAYNEHLRRFVVRTLDGVPHTRFFNGNICKGGINEKGTSDDACACKFSGVRTATRRTSTTQGDSSGTESSRV
jgi:hypothetical protein